MIVKQRKYLIIFILLLAMVITYAQSPTECKDIIRKYYKNEMAGIKFPKGNKVYYYSILFETEPQEYVAGYKKSVSVKIYLSENQLQYITDDVSVFQDRNDAFMVSNNPKIIVHSESGLSEEKEKVLSDLMSFSDSVITTSKVTNCQSVTNSKKEKLLLITMEISEKARKALNAERVIYQFNTKTEKLEKTTMYYIKGHKYKWSVMTNLETNLNYKKEMHTPVRDFFYDSNGKLLKKYWNYKIVDNR